MSKSKKPRRKRSPENKATNYLRGLICSWSAEDPLGDHPEIITKPMSHKNSIYRSNPRTMALITELMGTTMENMPMTWRVGIEMEFKADKPYFRAAELIYKGRIQDINDEYCGAVESMFAESNMAQYVTTHFTCEILGGRKWTDKDFKLCGGG